MYGKDVPPLVPPYQAGRCPVNVLRPHIIIVDDSDISRPLVTDKTCSASNVQSEDQPMQSQMGEI